jgi:Rieske Fe-S protein
MERRDFVKFCAVSMLASPAALAADARPRLYSRAKLVDAKGAPLKASAVPANQNLIFHYPFAATPCFLLNLGKPAAAPVQLKTADNAAYEWKGGVGPARSVVAYSAICAHRMSYPTRDISFISFRAEKSARNRHAAVIHCCSEHSQYDPAQGARVLAGPAPQPLAAILLEHDSNTDEIQAVGTLGGEMFNDFFQKFEFRLALEHPGPRTAVAGPCVVEPLENYCRQQVKC